MSNRRVHIIGAGLAGLSAAVHCRHLGADPLVYEAAPKAGGRVRRVGSHDNGTHLIIKGYQHTFEYLNLIGAQGELQPLSPASFQFYEPEKNLSWTIKAHHFLWEVAKGTIPQVALHNLFGRQAVQRFWEPFFISVFNTPLNEVPLKLLSQTFKELLKQGPDALEPFFPKSTLENTLTLPALKGLDIQFGKRLVGFDESSLFFKNDEIKIAQQDRIILALPLPAYQKVHSPLSISPIPSNPIVNIHFYLNDAIEEIFFGLIGTKSHWVYAKEKHACVTISNHARISDIEEVWAETSPFLSQKTSDMPKHRLICEKMATPRQNKAFSENRLTTKTKMENIFLAGDWIDTGLPATIESAIKSGKLAAQMACSS
ncbi:FAD-dependent oxidoreductase [Terasakiella sp. SH-1]|uniref:hydroxysqualene dehydroxylase n=1 Tax=Terasakiella sp. SH-1 TaxID=2560057 RepID=UPI00107476EF|nr:FAD-dependent oxidoreductase [Terasakiella sp. SH-1]